MHMHYAVATMPATLQSAVLNFKNRARTMHHAPHRAAGSERRAASGECNHIFIFQTEKPFIF